MSSLNDGIDEVFKGIGYFLGWLLVVVVAILSWVWYDNNHKQELERQRIEKFLIDHGDVVKIIRIHDEFKDHTHKNKITTVRRVWLTCQFLDGYNIEIEQLHGDSIARVPMVGERWRVKGMPLWSRLYFYQRIE